MGYLDKTGIVGTYHGYNVYVINYEDFSKPDVEDDTIYAVKRRGANIMDLVQHTDLIGHMDNDGLVEIMQKIKFFFAEPKQEEVSAPVGYSCYSRVVDEFFAGLEKLWEEMDV